MQGDEAAARAAFTSARVALDSLGAARPTDFRVYGAMGYAYAGLGLANEAVANANRYAREGTGNSTGDVYFTRQ